MIYLKGLVAGLGAVVIAVIATALVSAVIVLSSTRLRPGGGITSVSFGSGPGFWIAAVLIFAVGFWWELRRARSGLPFMPPLGFASLGLLLVVLGAIHWCYRPTFEGGITPQEQEPSR